MTKLKPADLFVLIAGASTTLYAIFLIAKMAFGYDVSSFEIQLMTLLTLINFVNMIHTSSK
jgi:hypothetical protein